MGMLSATFRENRVCVEASLGRICECGRDEQYVVKGQGFAAKLSGSGLLRGV